MNSFELRKLIMEKTFFLNIKKKKEIENEINDKLKRLYDF